MELIIDYSAIASEAKPKAKYGEELKISSPKQMLQRLSIVPAQVKAGNTSEKLQMKWNKLYILCIEQKKLLKQYMTI